MGEPTMVEQTNKRLSAKTGKKSVIADLRELVRALDRRVPRLERASEDQISREAAALRAKALDRISQLERAASSLDAEDVRAATSIKRSQGQSAREPRG
jgi:hypothetical protein